MTTTSKPTDDQVLEISETDVKYWREGADLVIEKNKGPGNDVEVEVQRNVFTDCGRFEEAARNVKRYVLERLKGQTTKGRGK